MPALITDRVQSNTTCGAGQSTLHLAECHPVRPNARHAHRLVRHLVHYGEIVNGIKFGRQGGGRGEREPKVVANAMVLSGGRQLGKPDGPGVKGGGEFGAQGRGKCQGQGGFVHTGCQPGGRQANRGGGNTKMPCEPDRVRCAHVGLMNLVVGGGGGAGVLCGQVGALVTQLTSSDELPLGLDCSARRLNCPCSPPLKLCECSGTDTSACDSHSMCRGRCFTGAACSFRLHAMCVAEHIHRTTTTNR